MFLRINPDIPDVIRCRNNSELEESHFDPSKPVKIYSHGWYGSSEDTESIEMKNGKNMVNNRFLCIKRMG